MKTLFIGQNIIYLKSVDSTNSYATEMLRQNNIPEGSLIYTFNQTNGRGQRGNQWESEPNKNVALSLVLHPTFIDADKQYLLIKIISLAVADLLADILFQVEKAGRIKIKWPNDIYIDDKKIGGILIENIWRDNKLQSSVVGIGININQTHFVSTNKSTSLALLTNRETDLKQVIEHLCSHIEARYLQLKTNKLENIDFEYLQRLYRLNTWNLFSANNQTFEGNIIGVADSGKLNVLMKTGETIAFDLKEIVFI
jgi:BirA family transcriptional regulator, biotin operon repressor / biotin---[acetyl-CoA-carboxylase] ligase